VTKLGLLVVAVCAIAAVALIPTDASALVVCWSVAPFGETVCLEIGFGAAAITGQGTYFAAFPCNGTTSIPARATIVGDGAGGLSMGVSIDFAAPAPGGNGGGCFADVQHVVLTAPSFGGTGSHRNVAGATSGITYTLSSISANETLHDVQERMNRSGGGSSSAGSP
jgi:hypothetical protein